MRESVRVSLIAQCIELHQDHVERLKRERIALCGTYDISRNEKATQRSLKALKRLDKLLLPPEERVTETSGDFLTKHYDHVTANLYNTSVLITSS